MAHNSAMNNRLILFALLTLPAPSPLFADDGKSAAAPVLSADTPIKGMNVYLVGFHPMKTAPAKQMEAHHYCRQMDADFMQCAVFNGNTKEADLTGVEYIISEKLFDALPVEEKKYWHPHDYEILSGQLVAPGLSEAADHALIAKKMNTYGKTWHFWDAGTLSKPGDRVPMGEPMLAWSFNHDGEVEPGLVERRDKDMGIDTNMLIRERKDLLARAHPQGGVDAIESKFPNARAVPGVKDSGATPEN
jgi:hypothetical protein